MKLDYRISLGFLSTYWSICWTWEEEF